MDFCPKCETRLRPNESSVTSFCRKCKQDIVLSSRIAKLSSNGTAARYKDIVFAINNQEAQLNVLPTTRIECPKCSHNRAYYRTLEIWDDDGDTMDFLIYRCTKCQKTWRERG